MSFADWLDATRHRLRRDPLPAAIATSARAFYRGAHAKLATAYYVDRKPYPTTIAGIDAHFAVKTPTDMKRARDLNGEANVAEFLFAGDIADAVVWDIGGYHGHYSVLAAQAGATVVTFEPDDLNRRRIATNAELNHLQLDIRPVALSDTDGRAAFGGDCGSELAVGAGAQTIETRRGDGIELAPDIVKVDVEGHETAVLDGLGSHLDTVERIAVEVHEGRGVDPGAVSERLWKAGLDVQELQNDRSQTYLAGVRR